MRITRIRRSAVAFAVAALSAAGLVAAQPAAAATVPRPDHVVIVVMENHSYNDVIGSSSAPYINNTLKAGGANFTQSFAVTHPSQPNYLELFSGSTQGVTDDSCPHTFSTENLGHQLIAAGDTFTGYSEGLPSVGYTGCQNGKYYRKHNPWVNFTNVPSSSNVPFSQFPTDYTKLPAVSFVIPNICNDMHDCSVGTGDSWLSAHINGYAQWAKIHNSVLILTFDEDDHSQNNQIPTIFYGQHVRTGAFAEHITHDNVLRSVEDGFTLACVAASCGATPITDIWF
ncbi:alkaline phosphatase family protein [Actinoallomurus sp. NPDC050550]|uniref:alkaline phosphatase family protein n=1 Tax=Actinoallomurus sp. NPDC050550 TaxID=3154937 RepID=UPI0033C25E6D